jgi:diguanylate cyclase (GGDEF)-like protein/hemerythrin-like metal-binding protein
MTNDVSVAGNDPGGPGDPRLAAQPGLVEVFAQFPLPLAFAPAPGGAWVTNPPFEACLDRDALGDADVARVANVRDQTWSSLRLPGRDGAPAVVRVQAVGVGGGTLLVFDASAGTGAAAATDALQARIAELERLSSTDALTGAWNRAHLDRVVESEISRSLRLRQSVSLILVDLDHFKRVNDTFGHPAGDAVLRGCVEAIRARVRGADQVFRWGGEEFVVLAPATPWRAAATLAQSLRATIAAQSHPPVGQVTASLGVAEHLAGEDVQAWFRRVDVALYTAKREGRDRVHVDEQGSSDAWAGAPGRSALRLAWQDTYDCGEPMIDEQHRELFERANALIDAMSRRPPDPDARLATLAALIEHVDRHFRDEEALLERIGYPKLHAHARSHAHLLERVHTIRRDLDEGRLRFGDVVDFLANDVVAGHMFGADSDFFPIFRGAGTG